MASRLGHRVGPARLHRVESLLLRGGGRTLFVGRCAAGARVVRCHLVEEREPAGSLDRR
jgi:hypothetical protein